MSDLGRELRDQAIERVERGNADWTAEAVAAVRDIAARVPEFTTDRVWYEVGRRRVPMPREPRAMGAVMSKARVEGLCLPTDRTVLSARPDCHRRPIRVWRSLVCRS